MAKMGKPAAPATTPTSRAGTWTSNRARAGSVGHAFTLLELVVVLVVIGICATVVFPKLGRLLVQEPEPQRSGRQLLRLAQYARALAVATESTVVLALDTETGDYWIAPRSREPATQTRAVASNLKGHLGPEVRIANVELSGEDWDPGQPVTIEFGPEGSCDAATVSLTGAAGRTVSVAIGEWSEEICSGRQDAAG